jgi:hypothetical protein
MLQMRGEGQQEEQQEQPASSQPSRGRSLAQQRPQNSTTTAAVALALTTAASPAQVVASIPTVSQPLSYARAQQIVRLAESMALSTGNLVQLVLLSLLNPNVRYAPSDRLQFNVLIENQTIRAHAAHIRETLQANRLNQAELRNAVRYNLRQVYVAAAGSPSFPDDEGNDWRNDFNAVHRGIGDSYSLDNDCLPAPPPPPPGDDDLPRRIAQEIALIYYENLELTLEDVQGVIKKYFPTNHDLKKINDSFINKIVHARIDKDRYELLTLLPDKDFIKAAVEQLKGNRYYKSNHAWHFPFLTRMSHGFFGRWNQSKTPKEPPTPLQDYKNKIGKIFDGYISWWKFSWFGHHHDKRARMVKSQIQSSQEIGEIQSILLRQQMIMNKQDVSLLPNTLWSNHRWNDPDTLKNIPADSKTSGYFKVLTAALAVPSPTP